MQTADPFRILIVDDEPVNVRFLRRFLEERQCEVNAAPDGRAAIEWLRHASADLVLLDLLMPEFDGLQTLQALRDIAPGLSVIVITAYGTIPAAIQAMKYGAREFLMKPLALDDLDRLVSQARSQRDQRYQRLRVGPDARLALTRNARIHELLDLVAKVAPLSSTILVQGESGTGKELVARAIHSLSPRAAGRFVAVNCGAIPAPLMESELFGHERGAFTGAEARRSGYFEAAAAGTLFLDEISEMPADLQVKLLRAVQERSFCRVGSSAEIAMTARIIASTNRDLKEEVRLGRFRQDLYFRINVVRLTIPPLRERRDDIPLLAFHFLERFAQEFGKDILGIEPEAMEILAGYSWHGNVRELQNVIERAVALCEGSRLEPRDLPRDLRRCEPATAPAGCRLEPFPVAKRNFERQYLIRALAEAGGNISHASRLTAIPRQNLYVKLGRLGIDRPGR